MTTLRLHRWLAVVLFLPVGILGHGCQEPNAVETISVALKNTETYQYPTVGGDEDGARISTQARHYSISEIRRDAATNWVATYVYQPAPGFVGSDYAEVEILTGSNGASAPTNVRKVAFRLVVGQ